MVNRYKKRALICFILIFCTLIYVPSVECSAMSVASAKKEYKRYLQYYVGWESSGTVSYAFLKFPGKKTPYLLVRDEYNYSMSGIIIHTIKNGSVDYEGKCFDGQWLYYYKKYFFVESFAGGGCGSIAMYKYKNGKFKKVKGGTKYIQENDNVQVHNKCMSFAKKKAKKMNLDFNNFKEIDWTEYQ